MNQTVDLENLYTPIIKKHILNMIIDSGYVGV